MNPVQIESLLKSHQNERGIDHWNKMEKTAGLRSYGIGLTQLRKLAKQIGRDHALAEKLWQSDCYDIKVISLLIDEPAKITIEQAEKQIEQMDVGMLCHVFSSCDATLAKSGIALDLCQLWLCSEDSVRKRCGYGLLYELSKNKRNKALTDQFFLDSLKTIDDTIDFEQNLVRLSMGGAMIGIGKRNRILNEATIKIAKRVGEIDYNDGESKCEPLNVMKHLTGSYIQTKLNKADNN